MPVSALEAHYYDGGLKTATFPEKIRLQALPNYDKVIFADTLTLTPQTVIFEVASFQSANQTRYLWIGCYLASTDRQFGDRANYVCVGLWLAELVSLQCKPLLRSLWQAALQLHKNGMTTGLEADMNQLYSAISDSYLYPRADFPPSCGGFMRQASSQTTTKHFRITGRVDEAITALESALINLQLAPSPFAQSSRVRFTINAEDKDLSAQDSLPSQSELLLPLVVGLPKIVENTASELAAVRKDLTEIVSENSKLSGQVTSLTSRLERASAERDALKKALLEQTAELEKLEKLPFTIINKQLKDVDLKLDQIAGSIVATSRHTPKPSYAPSPPRKRSNDDEGLAWAIFAYSLIGLISAILIGFGVYKLLGWLR